jgi:hypothetical protein
MLFDDSVQKRKASYENKVAFQSVLNGKLWGAAPQEAVSVRVVAKIARQAASIWPIQISPPRLMILGNRST